MKEDWYVLDVVPIFQPPFAVGISSRGWSCYGPYMVRHKYMLGTASFGNIKTF